MTIIAGMNRHIPDQKPVESQRMQDEAATENRPARLFSRSNSPLSRDLSDFQEAWLLDFACDQWLSHHGSLASWRAKMARFERQADGDYSDRKIVDRDVTNATEAIFNRQNFTLGMTAGFADYVHAQAKDELFGTRPWLAATPKGAQAIKLADLVTKESQWKIDQSNLEAVFADGIRQAVDLGTAFVKVRWHRDVETYGTTIQAAHSIATGEAMRMPDGRHIQDAESFGENADPEDVEWQEITVPSEQIVYDNAEAALLDWKNVAFDETKPDLDLRHTPFMHRFEMGAHDIANEYGLDETARKELLNMVNMEERVAQRDHRQEQDPARSDPYMTTPNSNPPISLVEGFFRCAPFGDGRIVRVACVYSPTLRILFSCDYLANVTPKGRLPVFPVRCFKTPGRITGKGYFEKYEDANNAIDMQYDSVTYRNRLSSVVLKGIHRNALADQMRGRDFVLDPDIVYELADGMTMTDLVSFAVIPSNDNMSVQLLNMMTQMAQMTSGITSASQGEIKGVPSANTATGTREIISRGAALVKVPVSQIKTDIEQPVEFAVNLIYANHEHDESFPWGSGQNAQIMLARAEDVQNLEASVVLTLTQSQNQSKLQSAQAGIQIGGQYAMLPETEKTSLRPLFIQALSALGFNDADRILREAAVTPDGVAQMLPPEMQGAFLAFMQSQGAAPQAAGQPPASPSQPPDPVAPLSAPPPNPTITP